MVEILSKQTIETSTANTLFSPFSLELSEDLYDFLGSAIIISNKDLYLERQVFIMKVTNNFILYESNICNIIYSDVF